MLSIVVTSTYMSHLRSKLSLFEYVKLFNLIIPDGQKSLYHRENRGFTG